MRNNQRPKSKKGVRVKGRICWTCKGMGIVTRMVSTAFGYFPDGWERCPKCGGKATR